MANLVVFNEFKHNIGLNSTELGNSDEISLEANTFNVMLVQASPTNIPTAAIADPRYGAGGTTDYSATGNEIDAGTNYSLGGKSIGAVTWTEATGTVTWTTADATTSWAVHASNPTDLARYAVIYDNTTTGKFGVCFLDIGQDFDMTAGTLTLDWDEAGAGLMQLA